MTQVTKANMTDLENIVNIDIEVIGNGSRRNYLKTAIAEGRCLVVEGERKISGFLVYDMHFFECAFISLVIIAPPKRRKGYASLLLKKMMDLSPTEKVFSSTNRSNESMQKVFEANGFVRSGIVENLDEGDPEVIYFKRR
ncbi:MULTISPECIES: GNAT family N-acetyltransferase [Bacillaceae]|uniref:GNAT family N-acetyltransferase n=1 Tax=Evansella alkalicola TaxID=745819 RepID=A0ABS6K047_9BACI|nr:MULTISPECIES: GNAT family N-acetyltransferase [Bacillaceae]MBU9724221.1 GNAT family N-acetyltransferase [Bacillus alkalicola]